MSACANRADVFLSALGALNEAARERAIWFGIDAALHLDIDTQAWTPVLRLSVPLALPYKGDGGEIHLSLPDGQGWALRFEPAFNRDDRAFFNLVGIRACAAEDAHRGDLWARFIVRKPGAWVSFIGADLPVRAEGQPLDPSAGPGRA